MQQALAGCSCRQFRLKTKVGDLDLGDGDTRKLSCELPSRIVREVRCPLAENPAKPPGPAALWGCDQLQARRKPLVRHVTVRSGATSAREALEPPAPTATHRVRGFHGLGSPSWLGACPECLV